MRPKAMKGIFSTSRRRTVRARFAPLRHIGARANSRRSSTSGMGVSEGLPTAPRRKEKRQKEGASSGRALSGLPADSRRAGRTAGQHVLSLRDPCHRFDAQRMQRPQGAKKGAPWFCTKPKARKRVSGSETVEQNVRAMKSQGCSGLAPGQLASSIYEIHRSGAAICRVKIRKSRAMFPRKA